MWAEIILTRDDLARILARALPLAIHLGDPASDHALLLRDLGEVQLVPDVGLRLICKARLHWPLLGVDVPVELTELTVLLIPTIEEGTETDPGDRLLFRASVEHASLSVLPALIADRVTAAVNERLATKDAELAWNFTKALRYVVPLPAILDPLESFAIRPAWGKLKVTSDAVVYAASFHSSLVRRGEAPPFEIAAGTAHAPSAVPQAPLTRVSPSAGEIVVSKRLLTATAYALAAGVAYFAVRGALRSRSSF